MIRTFAEAAGRVARPRVRLLSAVRALGVPGRARRRAGRTRRGARRLPRLLPHAARARPRARAPRAHWAGWRASSWSTGTRAAAAGSAARSPCASPRCRWRWPTRSCARWTARHGVRRRPVVPDAPARTAAAPGPRRRGQATWPSCWRRGRVATLREREQAGAGRRRPSAGAIRRSTDNITAAGLRCGPNCPMRRSCARRRGRCAARSSPGCRSCWGRWRTASRRPAARCSSQPTPTRRTSTSCRSPAGAARSPSSSRSRWSPRRSG